MESESLDRRLAREATLGLLVLVGLLAILLLTVYLKARTVWDGNDEHLLTQPVNVFTIGNDNVLVPTKLPPLIPLPSVESNEMVDLGEIRPMAPARLAEWLGGMTGSIRIATADPSLPLGSEPSSDSETVPTPTRSPLDVESQSLPTPNSPSLPPRAAPTDALGLNQTNNPSRPPNPAWPPLPGGLPTVREIPERAPAERAQDTERPFNANIENSINKTQTDLSSGDHPEALGDNMTKVVAVTPSNDPTARVDSPTPPLPTPGLPLLSLPLLSLPTPGLPSPGLPAPGLPATQPQTPGLPAPNSTAAGLPAPDATAMSLPTPSLPTPSLPTPSLPTPSLPTPSLPSEAAPRSMPAFSSDATAAVPPSATENRVAGPDRPNLPEAITPQPTLAPQPTSADQPIGQRHADVSGAVAGLNDFVQRPVAGPTYTVDQLKAAMLRVPLPAGASLLDLSRQLYGDERYGLAILQLNHRRADAAGQFPPGAQLMVLPAEMFEFVYPDLVAAAPTTALAADPGTVQPVAFADKVAAPTTANSPSPPSSTEQSPVRRSVLEPTPATPTPANANTPATAPTTEWIVTAGGESLFQLAGEYLDQASHYLTLYQWNYELLDGRYRPTDPLPRGLRLRIAPPTQR